jgi:hypothetical protein
MRAGSQAAFNCSRGCCALGPEGVDVGNEDRLAAQQGQGIAHAASGVEQGSAFVGDEDLDIGPPGEVGLQHVGEVVDVDHRPAHPRLDQAVQDPVNEGPAGHLHQGLGPGLSERTHPGSQASGEDHGAFGPPHRRASAGTQASSQSRRSARPGSARHRSR